jgi:hypothetical protein
MSLEHAISGWKKKCKKIVGGKNIGEGKVLRVTEK